MTNSAIEGTRLLVVSRDSAILRPLRSVGESNGWQLEMAADPWEAIERVQAREPLNAIVMDPVSYTHLDVYKRQVHGMDPAAASIRC